MSASASAAEAAVLTHHSAAAGVGPVSNEGALGERHVSQAHAAAQGPFVRGSRQGRLETGAGGTDRGIRSRLVTLLSSTYGWLTRTALPGLEVAAGATPGGTSSLESGSAAPDESPGGADREPYRGCVDLPWVAPGRHADRRAAQGRLKKFLHRQDIAAELKQELFAAVGMVSRVERDVAQADALLKRARNEVLADAEWRGLSELISSTGHSFPAFDSRWDGRLGQLLERANLSEADMETMRALHRRLVDAGGYFYSDDMPWEDSVRRFATVLPDSRTVPVIVESRIIPGTALRACFAEGCPALYNIRPGFVARYRQVPGLEQTVLTNANGELLFSGLRHALLEANHLTGERLAGLSNNDLRALVADLYSSAYGGFEASDPARRREVDNVCLQIRSHPSEAMYHARLMQITSRCAMAREAAVAALAADPAKLQRALDGKTVDLHLFVIALLTSIDSLSWVEQRHAFLKLVSGSRGPVNFQVRGPDGEPRTVLINLKVEHLRFSTDEDRILFDGRSVLNAGWLLGSLWLPDLGGAAKSEAAAMRTRALKLRKELVKLGPSHLQTTRKLGVDHHEALPTGNRLSMLKNEMHRLEKKARTLELAGQQLKDIWTDTSGLLVDAEEHMKAAARLALIAHLMGGMPLLNCASGRDFTEELDSEIKFLATVADSRNGQLAPLDRDEPDWRRARDDFRPH